MLLVDLQMHFFNNNILHYERLVGWQHDVYINPKNKKKATIPINESVIPDIYCGMLCSWLEIEGIDGKPFVKSSPNQSSEHLN